MRLRWTVSLTPHRTQGPYCCVDTQPPSPYLLFKQNLAGLVALPRRESAGMHAPNTRDVPAKMEPLLDIIEGMVMEHLQV
jgi:hypothetical protein